jgi:hypothetical protein
MTDAEKIRRDAETVLEAIRLSWVELAATTDPVRRGEVRQQLRSHQDNFSELVDNLDRALAGNGSSS